MPYFSIEHVKAALDYTTSKTHASLLSVLALALAGGKVGETEDALVIGGGTAEINMIRRFFRLDGAPEERPYALLFGPHLSASRFKNSKYPGASLQRQRQGKRSVFWQPAAGDRRWSFASDVVNALKEDHDSVVGDIPVRTAYLAAWFYRDREIGSVDEAVENFVREFRLNELGLVPDVFDESVPAELAALPLSEEPPTNQEILELIRAYEPEEAVGDPQAAPLAAVAVLSAAPAPGDWSNAGDAEHDLDGLKGVEEPARRAFAALRAGLQVIFTGPPGTGKTTLAEAIVKRAGFPTWTVPATDQWTTFETIGGYFPMPKDDGMDRLDFLAGAVVGSIEDGKCLIIDEINRADIDKAFGELFTLLTGKSVTLPYRRRAADGSFKRIRLQIGSAYDDEKFDLIPVPDWWRIIGAMNDVDKASLKRLSMAFVRRFAFVPIDLPPPDVFASIVREAVARTDALKEGVGDMSKLEETLIELFAHRDRGFGEIGLHLGPAFPRAIVRQADAEWTADPQRPLSVVLSSVIELHVMPQMQGRPELHERFLAIVRPIVEDAEAIERHLEVWSGYVGA